MCLYLVDLGIGWVHGTCYWHHGHYHRDWETPQPGAWHWAVALTQCAHWEKLAVIPSSTNLLAVWLATPHLSDNLDSENTRLRAFAW